MMQEDSGDRQTSDLCLTHRLWCIQPASTISWCTGLVGPTASQRGLAALHGWWLGQRAQAAVVAGVGGVVLGGGVLLVAQGGLWPVVLWGYKQCRRAWVVCKGTVRVQSNCSSSSVACLLVLMLL